MTLAAPLLLALTLTPDAAAADDAAYTDETSRLAPTEVINDRFAGVGVGFDVGLWGDRFGSGVKVDIPAGTGTLGQHFGVRLRGISVHDDTDAGFSPVLAGGAELFGRGPVMLGVVRVYGGGGLYCGGTVDPIESALTDPALIGGGHFGVEFVHSPRTSFTFEVGGQGPMHADEIDAGASVMAGMTVYLGKVKERS